MATFLLGQQCREFRMYMLIGLVILGFDTFHIISIIRYQIIDM